MCGPYLWTRMPCVVVVVVGVAADVRALVDDEHALAELGGQPLGEDDAGEAGADDEGVEHGHGEAWRLKMCLACDATRVARAAGIGEPGREAPAPRLRRAPGALDERLPWLRRAVPRRCRRGRRASSRRGACARRRPRRGPPRGCDERLGRVGEVDDVAVGLDDVADRGRDDGLAGGQVLGRLGRADEARRVVARERQQGDVPAGEVGRQLVVGLAAETVDVGAPRQRSPGRS